MHIKKLYFTAGTFVFLVSIYPVLAMLGYNISEVNIQVVFRPLLFSLLFTALVLSVFYIVVRDITKAALLTGLTLILFFSYGHLYYLLEGFKIGNLIIGRQRFLFLLYISLFVIIGYAIISKKQSPVGILQILNVMAIGLIVFPIFQIGSYQARDTLAKSRTIKEAEQRTQNQIPPPVSKDLPDIYYIILDMYTRDDVLKQDIGFDNSAFLNALKQMGFYIGECSQSNYGQTQLSLASSLNMNYLTELGSFNPNSTDRTVLDDLIEYSAVRDYLEKHGYATVSLSAYQPLKIESAAVYFSTDSKDISTDLGMTVISPFEALFIKSTAFRALTDIPQIKSLPIVRTINYPYINHVRQQLYILETINQIPNIPGPKFVFIHIQIPHPPFVFGPDGQMVDDPPPFPSNPAHPTPIDRQNKLYRDQITFINKQILEILPGILNYPGPRPIVVIQGDHGIYPETRTSILNAYYVPQAAQKALYSNISPVNTFRVLLNSTFENQFDLLPDMSFDSSYSSPFQFQEMVENRPGCDAKK